MPDIIQLKPAEQLDVPAPGEVAIDEAEGVLLLDRGDSAVTDALPLDVLAIPEVAAPAGSVYIFQNGEIVAAPLTAGGGGRPFDEAEWRVPGVIVLVVEDLEVDGVFEQVIEITQPCQLTGLMVLADGAGVGDPPPAVMIETEAGTNILDDDLGVDGTLTCDVELTPGRYIVMVETFEPATFRAIVGCRAWGQDVEQFPVFLKVT